MIGCILFAASIVVASDIVAHGVLDNSSSKFQSSRWYFIHCITNLIIAKETFYTVCMIHDLPRMSDGHDFKALPIVVAILSHIYHILFFKLTTSDRIHHGIFIPTIGIPGAIYDWGHIGNLQLFFICGLPGFLIYLSILWNRHATRRVNEPLVSVLVNIFLRAPGILVSNAILLDAVCNSKIHPPLWAAAFQLTLAPTNGVYYAYESFKRYRRVQEKKI